MIAKGKFPESDREILISQEYARTRFGEDVDFGGCIGQSVIFKGMDFTVSGVLGDPEDDDFSDNFNSDIYYQRDSRIPGIPKENLIFIDYGILKTIGEEYPDIGFIQRVYDGLYRDKAALNWLSSNLSSGAPNLFYNRVSDMQGLLDSVTKLFTVVLLVSYVTACLFLIAIVQTELFYRKKELGYLQIFGLSVGKISGMVLAGYLLKILAATALSA